jgi:hypothetical protein
MILLPRGLRATQPPGGASSDPLDLSAISSPRHPPWIVCARISNRGVPFATTNRTPLARPGEGSRLCTSGVVERLATAQRIRPPPTVAASGVPDSLFCCIFPSTLAFLEEMFGMETKCW